MKEFYTREEARIILEAILEAYNKDNFFNNTIGTWNRVNFPRTKPDYESKSGSRYWHDKEGVTRVSNHWGTSIGDSHWRLRGEPWRSSFFDRGTHRAGYIRYRNLHPADESEPRVKRMWRTIRNRENREDSRSKIRYYDANNVPRGKDNKPVSQRVIAREAEMRRQKEKSFGRRVAVKKSNARRFQQFIDHWNSIV